MLLGWIGLVPWLATLDRPSSLRAAVASGVLFSVCFTLAVFGWFAAAIRGYTGAPWPVAVAVLVLCAPLLQPQLVVFAAARHVARRVLSGFWAPALAAACCYVGAEWACGKLFGDTIGHGLQASAWMRQAADLAGAGGLTLVLLVANEAVLATASCPRRALVPVGLACALLAYGAVRCRQLAAGEPVLTAGIVQADLGDYEGLRAAHGTYDAVRAILDTHFAMSRALLARGCLDVVVWPETVYPTTFGSPKSPDGGAFDDEIRAFIAQAGVPLVFGTYDAAGGREYNAAAFLTPAGGTTMYRKARLFPLTERVPAWLDSPVLRRRLPWLGTWRPGAGRAVVPLALPDGRTVRVAPLVCYDAVDPRLALAAVRDGAEVLLTLSNDAWFAAGLGPRLHLVVSAFRSIETRRPQVRATNTGVSAVIDATGEIGATLGVHERGTLVARVHPRRDQTTLMLAWGDWLGPAALVAGLAALAAGAGWRLRAGRANSGT